LVQSSLKTIISFALVKHSSEILQVQLAEAQRERQEVLEQLQQQSLELQQERARREAQEQQMASVLAWMQSLGQHAGFSVPPPPITVPVPTPLPPHLRFGSPVSIISLVLFLYNMYISKLDIQLM
jgi:hypothetical protein